MRPDSGREGTRIGIACTHFAAVRLALKASHMSWNDTNEFSPSSEDAPDGPGAEGK